MKKILICLAMGISLFSTGSAWAQEEGENPERPRRDGEMRERMIKEFDADGNGELSDEERQTARETMRERRGGQGDGRGQGRGPGQGRGRGQGQRGEGRPAPPDPNKLFDEFDADKDGQLSREEFVKLTEAQRDRRPPRPPREGRPGGPRPEGDDRPGPPPEGREFDGQPPLQNQAGPPRGEGRGRGGEGFGPPPGPRGPEGRGPDPNRMFDRFDENGDDQLSREEFMQLSTTLRDMRERFTEGGPRGRGPRGGGFGPPDREGRPPRPQRPEAEPEAPPADEDVGSDI